MRTAILVLFVVVAHIVAIAGVAVIQGCGTPVGGRVESYDRTEVIMPPAPVVDMPPPRTYRPPVAAAAPDAAWPVQTTVYVVRRGDTLSGIAHRYKLSASDIVTLNQLKNKNVIVVGQKLILPGKLDVAAAPRPSPRSAPAAAAGPGGNYVVASGDTLSGIAVKFNTRVSAIKQANNLTSDRIYAGQKLMIPGAGAAPAPEPAASRPAPRPPAAVPAPIDMEMDTAPIVDMPPPVAEPIAAPAVDTPSVDAVAVPAGAATHRIYVVGENEDLYSVGLLWNVSVAKIKELNNLTDTTLTPGQRLKIPTTE